MLKRILLFAFVALVAGGMGAAAQDDVNWSLTQIDSVENVVGESVAEAFMSPDGSTIAWIHSHAICTFSLGDSAPVCFEGPEKLERPMTLAWSPDSQSLAFTEDVFKLFFESDLWTLDVTSGLFVDHTDDGVERSFLAADPPPRLDYMPVWNPATGDLFFFGSAKSEDGYSLYLYRLGQTEPELVADWTDTFPTLSIYLQPVISDDGSQMAMIVLGQKWDDPRNGIWVVNLPDGWLDLRDTEPRQVATMADFRRWLPGWQSEGAQPIAESVQWAAGGKGLVVGVLDARYATSHPSQNYLYIDLDSDTVTPLVDFSDVPDQQAMLMEGDGGFSPIFRIPRAGVVSPDGGTFFFLHWDMSPDVVGVSALALPPDGSEATLLGTTDEFVPPVSLTATIGSDGHAILAGYLLTFARK